ncbi:hypothetical protein SprV_0100193000 [Sparganum proliferum]
MSVKSGQPRTMVDSSCGVGSPHTPTTADVGLGLQAIYRTCFRLYPDQPSPLQVTALRKFWMGGPDPLDYIYMFSNAGSADSRSPPHWHYVTTGLSDLYGDARLHNYSTNADGPSGFGFELTFRLRREPGEKNPPTWPAHLLQSLARYVFRSQAQLLPGDHIPWHCPLDELPNSACNGNACSKGTAASAMGATRAPTQQGSAAAAAQQQSIAMAAVAAAASLIAAQSSKQPESLDPATYSSALAAAVSAANAEYQRRTQQQQQQAATIPTKGSSRIRHMLLVDDPQLMKISTPHGWVRFLQIVGLCEEELRLVQRWTGCQVADLFRQQVTTGGPLLVTDMRRNKTIFELEGGLAEYINERMAREGSNLSGVTTQFFAWAAITPAQMAEPLPGEQEALVHALRRRGASALKTPLQAVGTSSGSNTSHLPQGSLPTYVAGGSHHPPDSSASTAMETDDSGSVTTLHQASSVVRAAKMAGGSATDDDEIIDIVGDGGSSSAGTGMVASRPRGGATSSADDGVRTKTEDGAETGCEDTEMQMMGKQQQQHQEENERLNNTSADLSLGAGSRSKVLEEQNSAPGSFSIWGDRVAPLAKNSNPLSFCNTSKTSEMKSTDHLAGDKNGTTNFGSCDALLGTDSTTAAGNNGGALGFVVFDRHRSSIGQPKLLPPNRSGRNAHAASFSLTPGMSSPSISTPGSVTSLGSNAGCGGGGESAPCTPLAHLSLSPASLELLPSRVIEWLDIHLSLEAGELLPLAICDRLKHGRHFTFLNAHSPEHAITLVPPGVTGAIVSSEVPYVSRGPWLQVFLSKDFLEQLESQFSILQYPEDIVLPLVFRWPERRLRICLLESAPPGVSTPSSAPQTLGFHAKSPVSSGSGIAGGVSPSSLHSDGRPPAKSFSPYASPPVHCFPHFPPGCVPPPSVMAAFINSASTWQQQQEGSRRSMHGLPTSAGTNSSTRSPDSVPFALQQPAAPPHFPFPSKPSPVSPAPLMQPNGDGGGPTLSNLPPMSADTLAKMPPEFVTAVRAMQQIQAPSSNPQGFMEAMQAMFSSFGSLYRPSMSPVGDSKSPVPNSLFGFPAVHPFLQSFGSDTICSQPTSRPPW